MIVIYINSEGTAQVVSPSHIYQGSNQSNVTVFAPVPTTTALSIAFKLPDGTSTPYYPMTYIQNSDGLSQYEFTLNASLTQKAGQSAIALMAKFTDGRQTSQLIEFEIEPSVLPELPESIDENAYEIIMQYLQQDRSDITAIQGQINDIEETADNAEKASQNAVDTANEAKDEIDGAIQEIADYKSAVDDRIDELEKQIAEGTGTIVEVAGKEQAKVSFTSDPQTQLDEKANQDGTYPDMSVGKATDDSDGNNISETYVKVSDLDKLILELEYPIGGKPYIQFPGMKTPAERWANTTWELDTTYADRMFIANNGNNALGGRGGEANHKLTIDEIPAHMHGSRELTYGVKGGFNGSQQYIGAEDFYTSGNAVNTTIGGSQFHNNMPPYFIVNYWKRTA